MAKRFFEEINNKTADWYNWRKSFNPLFFYKLSKVANEAVYKYMYINSMNDDHMYFLLFLQYSKSDKLIQPLQYLLKYAPDKILKCYYFLINRVLTDVQQNDFNTLMKKIVKRQSSDILLFMYPDKNRTLEFCSTINSKKYPLFICFLAARKYKPFSILFNECKECQNLLQVLVWHFTLTIERLKQRIEKEKTESLAWQLSDAQRIIKLIIPDSDILNKLTNNKVNKFMIIKMCIKYCPDLIIKDNQMISSLASTEHNRGLWQITIPLDKKIINKVKNRYPMKYHKVVNKNMFLQNNPEMSFYCTKLSKELLITYSNNTDSAIFKTFLNPNYYLSSLILSKKYSYYENLRDEYPNFRFKSPRIIMENNKLFLLEYERMISNLPTCCKESDYQKYTSIDILKCIDTQLSVDDMEKKLINK